MGERYVIVDESITHERSLAGEGKRYFGRRGWGFTVVEARPYESREAALAVLDEARQMFPRTDVRRVVPAGSMRARLDATEANVATLRAQIDGLQATDEESATALASAIADRDKAIASLAEVEAERDTLAGRVAELQRLLSPEVGEAAE